MGVINVKRKIEGMGTNIHLYLPMGGNTQVGTNIMQRGVKSPNEGFIEHDEDEYLYLMSGELKFITPDQEWVLKTGEFNFIPKFTGHRLETISETEARFVFFTRK